MSANLYDILNVDESADAAEIRAAWKSAVADLDPTDRRFRAFNDAAAVLLDADKRREYDAQLAAARPVDEPADQPTDESAEEPAAAPVVVPAKDDTAADAPADEPSERAPSAGPAGWLLGAVGAGALVALVLAIVLLVQPGGSLFADDSPKKIAEANASYEKSSLSAEGAAERLVAPVFSYSYKTMEDDLARAKEHLAPELAAKQTELWPELTEDAVAQQIVVDAQAEAVALTRLSKDGKDASVLVFIVQESTKKAVAQTPLRMWVSLDLELASGSEDDWKVSKICVDDGCKLA